MLKRENRLSKVSSKAENKITTPLFGLSFSKNGLGLSRFSFVISKKVDKRATVRNATKRKIRSVIEDLLEKIERGNDFVFYLKTGSVGVSRDDARKEIEGVFLKNKLLR